jgi:hypothetical protein
MDQFFNSRPGMLACAERFQLPIIFASGAANGNVRHSLK